MSITKKEEQAYNQGYLDALEKVHKFLDDCWKRNIQFQIKFPRAPRHELLYCKYAGMAQEAHLQAIQKWIDEVKKS